MKDRVKPKPKQERKPKQEQKQMLMLTPIQLVKPTQKQKASAARKKVIISPDDFGDDGKLFALAPKRRKIEITKDKLAEIRQNQWRMKKRRIKYEGKGVEKTFIPYTENIVYEYYDDPNELVDRLILLLSSKSAGNSNHDQEINSIVEELR